MTGRLSVGVELSPMQRGVWFVGQLPQGAAVYVVALGLRFVGPCDPAALARAVAEVHARHAMLRVCIIEQGTELRQQVLPGEPYRLAVSDLRELDLRLARAEAARLAESIVAERFELAAGEVFRAHLIRIGSHESLLVLAIHHVVADGHSAEVLRGEILQRYTRHLAGADVPDWEDEQIFLDHIGSRERTGAADSDLEWWRAHLADAPRRMGLEGLQPRPAVQSMRGFRLTGFLGSDTARTLRATANRFQVTPFVLGSCALHLLLNRAAGQRTTVVGFPESGRKPGPTQDAIGPFVRMLVQRLDHEPGRTVSELVRALSSEMLDCLKHSDLRLDRLPDLLGIERDLGAHPVFQATLNYQGKDPEPVHVGDTTVLHEWIGAQTARFDLEYWLAELPDGRMRVMLQANADIFTESRAEQYLQRYLRLLGSLAGAEEQDRVADLAWLSDSELDAATTAARGAPALLEHRRLGELLDSGLTESAARTVVRDDEGDWTAAELLERSHTVTAALRRAGAGPGSVVAVRMPRSRALIAAVTGVALADAVLLPLDPDDPPARAREQIRQAGASLVLLASMADVPGDDVPVLLLDSEGEPGSAPMADTGAPRLGPDAAYILFTSGSTGRPKGVVVGHAALANRLAGMRKLHDVGEQDTVLHKTPAGFDVSLWELFLPLVTGACVRVARPGGHRDPEYLADVLAEGVTIAHFVPSMLAAVSASPWAEALGGLRLLVCSGETLPATLARDILRLGVTELWNYYGPTEAAIDVTAHRVTGRDKTRVPIGRPQPGCVTLLLDAEQRPVPAGTVGEIYIGGVQLALGYLGRPDLTADAFVPDPFSPDGDRLYRTGDLACLDGEGDLVFLGRRDRQVKIAGVRVEPAEVDAVLITLESVVSSITLPDPRGGERLVSWVQPADGPRVDELERRCLEQIERELPLPMIPAAIVVLDELPLSRNGKLDIARLPLPEREPDGGLAPVLVDKRIRTMAEAWQAVLGVRPQSVSQSFFLAGGDSIRSIALVAEAGRRGLRLTVTDVFAAPTLAGLARIAGVGHDESVQRIAPFALLTEAEQDTLAPVAHEWGGLDDAFPLSSLMSGLVYESRTNSGYLVYTTALQLRGRLDVGMLRDAVARSVRAHGFLRSTVRTDLGGRSVQCVHREVPDPVEVFDLRDRPDARELWLRDVTAERSRAFDWTVPPLQRIRVHRLDETDWGLTLTEPYLDGWSVTTMLAEILDGYRLLLSGERPAPLPGDDGVYPAFVATERAALDNAESRRLLRERMGNLPPSDLTAPDDSGKAAFRRIEVPIESAVSAALLDRAAVLGLPLKSVLLAVHLRALAAVSGHHPEVATAVTLNGRPEMGSAVEAVGMFLNNVVLRASVTHPSGAPVSLADLARTAHEAEAALLPHRRMPWAWALRAGAAGHVNATFNYTHFRPLSDFDTGPVRIVDRHATDQTYFALTVQFRRDALDNAVHLAIEVQGALVERADEIAEAYRKVTAEAGVEPVRGSVSVQSPGASAQPPTSRGDGVYQLFRSRVEEAPERTALIESDRHTSYAELDRRVRALAAALADRGVAAGDAVGVCLPRGRDLVTALVAVQALGAAYVPLDPALPPSRRRDYLATGGVGLVTGYADLLDGLDLPGVTALALDGLPLPDAELPVVPANLDAAAYVVFTSGSTGCPKGVAVPVSALLNRLRWGWSAMPLQPGDRCAARTPIAFVDSVAELLSPLLEGVPTVFVPDSARSPQRLAEALNAQAVTRVTIVPTLLDELLRQDLVATLLSGVRTWISSGEPLLGATVRALRQQSPSALLWNLYGSSEVAGDVTAHRCCAEDDSLVHVSAGRPINGVGIEIHDPDGQPCPVGTTGEVVVRGAALALGYLGRPAETAERFRPDPAGAVGERVFRTGDLGMFDEHGELHLLGRLDRQIKVRGVRLEPAEIENALRSATGVSHAAVDVRRLDGRDHLVAWLQVPEGNGVALPADAELARRLGARLPSAAVPDRIVRMTSWPTTVSGKTDVKALADPEAPTARDNEELPTGLIETEIAAIWTVRLGSARIFRDTDFFDVGGTSLLAIMVAEDLAAQFGIDVGVTEIFDNRTVRALAELLTRCVLDDSESTAGALGRKGSPHHTQGGMS